MGKEDKRKVVVSGATTGEEEAFPKEAVKAFHEKPMPTHEKTAVNKPRIIQQPGNSHNFEGATEEHHLIICILNLGNKFFFPTNIFRKDFPHTTNDDLAHVYLLCV